LCVSCCWSLVFLGLALFCLGAWGGGGGGGGGGSAACVCGEEAGWTVLLQWLIMCGTCVLRSGVSEDCRLPECDAVSVR